MEELKKYCAKLTKEAIINSIIASIIVGFTAFFVASTICWYVNEKNMLIPILSFVIPCLASFPIWYYLGFRPSEKAIATRVDSLGLEERILTMSELKNDNSYIAKRQREDAMAALKTIDKSLIKTLVPISLSICLAVSFVFGVGFGTLNVLASNGVINGGSETLNNITDELKETVYHDVIIEVYNGSRGTEQNGLIVSDMNAKAGSGSFRIDVDNECVDTVEMVVADGEDGESVITAVADEGSVFVAWMIDGEVVSEVPEYSIEAVTDDLVISAVFQKLEESEGDGEGEGGGGEPDEEGEPGDPSGGEPGEESEGADQGQPNSGGGQGEGWSENGPGNQAGDGETNYGGLVGEGNGSGDGGDGYVGGLSGSAHGGN